jgi:hypothetical protein
LLGATAARSLLGDRRLTGVFMPVLTDIKNGLLRYATGQYILENPVTVALSRKTKVLKPGGGHDKTSVELPPQQFRLVNQSEASGIEYSGSDDGQTRQFSYLLLGAWDADIQIDDSWTEGEIHYHVDAILPTNDFEVKATVTAFAKRPTHG